MMLPRVRIAVEGDANAMPRHKLRLPITTLPGRAATAADPPFVSVPSRTETGCDACSPRTSEHHRTPRSISRPIFEISPASWELIEKAYQHQIPLSTRGQIEVATVDYLQLAKSEELAAPLKSACDEILKTHEAARDLLERLQAIHRCTTDTHSTVRHLISQWLKLPTRPPLSDHLGDFIDGLELLTAALSEIDAEGAYKLALAETADAKVERDGVAIPMPRKTAKSYASAAYKKKLTIIEATGTQQEGAAWRNWVRKLVAILKKAKPPRPAGVSKVSDYPLLRLVNALQNELPWGRKTSASSLRSLAEAIYDAARSA
jgi:hypothetical protein